MQVSDLSEVTTASSIPESSSSDHESTGSEDVSIERLSPDSDERDQEMMEARMFIIMKQLMNICT